MSRTLQTYLSRTLLVTVLGLLAAASLAAGEPHWYVNAKLGEGSLDAKFNRTFPMHFEGHDETGAVELGYVLNRHLAVQAGYHDLGEYRGFGPSCNDEEVLCLALANDRRAALCVEGAPDCGFALAAPMTADVSGLSLAVVPRWPMLDDRLAVFGKLGVIDWNVGVSGLGQSETFSDRDLLSGLGVQYNFRKGLGVLVEYQRMSLDHDSASVGASWRF